MSEALIIEVLQLISYVLGFATVVLGIIRALIEKNKLQKWKITRKHVFIILFLFILVAVPVVVYSLTTRPAVSITSPTDGTVVSMEQQVNGVSSHIPQDSKIWVAVRSGSIYYPQPEPMVNKAGNWTCNARFGDIDDGGLPFVIIVLVANRDAQIELTEKNEFKVFPPLGSTIHETITVYRAIYATSPTLSDKPSVTTTPSSQTSVTIVSPANNAYVDRYEWVSGTSQNIPVDQHLWLIVQVNGMYFAHEVETINTDGTWRHNTMIGQEDETGKKFDLLAVLADSPAHTTLKDWRDKQNTEQQYDLKSLPSTGVKECSAITITRRTL
jgi:hypothetical protein